MFRLITTATTLLLLMTAQAAAQVERFQEGTHFERIGSPVSVEGDQVEVIEAFAYPCPACRNFLPHITRWEEEAPDYVSFSRLPIALQRGWDVFALAYYTARELDLGHEAHEAVFRELHDERRQVRSFEDIAEIYSEFGVDAEEFVSQSQSFTVDSRMRQNRNQVSRFGVRQTPTMIVQGKWRVSPRGFDDYDHMLEAVDFLVEREAEALGLEAGDQGNDVPATE